MKRCSTFLVIRERQIKITMRYYLIPVRMAIIKMSANNKCQRGYKETGTLLHCRWECKLVQPLWRTVWRFLKKGKIATMLCLITQSCPTLWDPMDCSPPGSCVHGILQARTLEWGAMPSSRGCSQPRD